MHSYFFLKGLLLGFAIAAPVGPIGVLCIRRTVQFGRLSGLFTGLGAAAADTIYAVIAAFGLALISDFLVKGRFWVRLFGGFFLIYLGIRTYLASPEPPSNVRVTHKTLLADFFSTFFLTLSNPMTIFSFLAVFAGLGLTRFTESFEDAIRLVFGVLLGSSLWWLILSEGITFFRKRVSQKVMGWINKAAGLLILAFGLLAWLSLYWR